MSLFRYNINMHGKLIIVTLEYLNTMMMILFHWQRQYEWDRQRHLMLRIIISLTFHLHFATFYDYYIYIYTNIINLFIHQLTR